MQKVQRVVQWRVQKVRAACVRVCVCAVLCVQRAVAWEDTQKGKKGQRKHIEEDIIIHIYIHYRYT